MDEPGARVIMRRRRVALAALVVLIAGIGLLLHHFIDQGSGGPPTVGGSVAESVTVVNNLQRALAGRDYQTICDDLFTSAAREAAGGDNCPSVLAQAGARIAGPTVTIRTVAVGGDQATVAVMAGAAGQVPASDELHLTREGGHLRIASAGIVPTR
jgi:hypothetical protein